MKIKRENDKIILHLHKDLYRDDCIDKAIRDFEHICKIKSGENEKYFLIEFAGAEESEELAMEFANYVLSLLKISGE
ncbi:MAG: hypothetical protein DRP54_09730 [Spirochaetes bacterium]|nr:MAG: hypothetical protein DRP54_09730 [Spirochaetota bacterium]